MHKRLAGLLLAVALAAAACSSGTSNSSSGGGASKLGADRVKIGLLFPFSGPIGFLGQFIKNSVQVEVDRINAAGGIDGTKIDLVTRDTQLNPQLAIQGAQELAGDRSVVYIMGPAFTGLFDAVRNVLEQNKKVNCQMAVSGPEALNGLHYSFRDQDPDQFRTVALVDYLAQHTSVKSLGIVYEDDDTGKGYQKVFPQLLQQHGMTYAGFQATRPDDQTHVPQVEALKSADAILVSNNSTSAGLTAAAAAQTGYKGQLVSMSGIQGYTYLEGGGDAAKGTIFESNYLGYFTRTSPDQWPQAYRQHVQAVIQRFGETKGPKSGVKQYNGTALAADCVVLWQRAVSKAGSLDPDKVVSAWEGLDVPADQMPSFVHAQFGSSDHEAYGTGDLFIYQWQKDSGGWYLKTLSGPPVS